MWLPLWVPGKPLVVLCGTGDTLAGSLQLIPLLDRRLGQRILKKPADSKPEDTLRSLSEDLRKGAITGDGGGAGSTRTGDASECKLDCDWDGHSEGSEKAMGWGISRSSPGGNEAG